MRTMRDLSGSAGTNTLQKTIITIKKVGSEDDKRIVLDTDKGDFSFFKKKMNGTRTTAYHMWQRDGLSLKEKLNVAYEENGVYKTIKYFIS